MIAVCGSAPPERTIERREDQWYIGPMKALTWIGVAVAGICVGACGTTVTEFGGGGSGGGTGGSTSTSSGTGGSTSTSSGTGGSTSTSSGTGGSTTGCPPTPAADGAECDEPGLKCEYGDGPIIGCRGWMECGDDELWFVMDPNCMDWPPPAVGCPPQPPQPGQCPMDLNGTLCLYPDDTQCGCTNCLGGPCGGPPQWVCVPPPGGSCPSKAPNFGQPCSPDGLECLYGSCSLGTQGERDCDGGVWVDVEVACPL